LTEAMGRRRFQPLLISSHNEPAGRLTRLAPDCAMAEFDAIGEVSLGARKSDMVEALYKSIDWDAVVRNEVIRLRDVRSTLACTRLGPFMYPNALCIFELTALYCCPPPRLCPHTH
jgi:hypothetical protein